MCARFDFFHSGILHNVEVVDCTSFTYTGKDQYFNTLENIGFKMHIPDNALPAEVDECQVHVESSVRGQFQFPPETELISGVYWITSAHKFTKSVTIEIQHCAKPEHLQHLTFVVAKHTQENLPYEFTTLDGGVFPRGSEYGKIERTHFCGLAIAIKKNLIKLGLKSVGYCGQLYYQSSAIQSSAIQSSAIQSSAIQSWDVHFVIVRNLKIYLKVSISAVNRAQKFDALIMYS